ncbi:hypothetical protein EVAR_85141_1 [Eumeta japonica]|uniref:Retrovirus-related Pol polyprotein from type-1 retrotransposable element R1 4 n=1 Tax=Eumeta variegata TaxID=151549 RepID=A0A4C1XS46_EUMVA|nr:hypothetical protein EVAR_85141_1 [Eumeta japonica]
MCGQTDEDMHHVLWTCPLYDDIRAVMLGGLENLRLPGTDCAADSSEKKKEEDWISDEDRHCDVKPY